MATPGAADYIVEPEVSTQIVETSTAEHEAEATGIAAIGVNGPLLAAQIVNFLLLLLILRAVLYKPLLGMLHKRRETIEAGMKAAEASQQQLAAASRETAEQLAAARAQAKQIVDEAKTQAQAVANDIKATASQEAEALLVRTRAQLTKEQEAIVAKAERELGDLIVRATERVVGRQELTINPKDVVAALADAKATR